MVVGSAHTRVLVRDWVLVRDVGSTNAFEAVRRKATALAPKGPAELQSVCQEGPGALYGL